MKRIIQLAVLLMAGAGHFCLGGPPLVAAVRAIQRPGTQLVDIYYSLSGGNGGARPMEVRVSVSENGGTNYNVPVRSVTGAVGPGVTPGSDLHIVWNAGADWPGHFNSHCRVRVTADDGTMPTARPGMARIPGGVFQMGEALAESRPTERPVHQVYVSGFMMDVNEVARGEWNAIYGWALRNGYTFNQGGSSRAIGHPIQSVSWHDAVKWCNARSEREGLAPCYFTDAAKSTVYRTGVHEIDNRCVNWSSGGYRLPTEAEWEKAARGGLTGQRFPWGDTISHDQANYDSRGSVGYDISSTRDYHPVYRKSVGGSMTPYTSPVGSFGTNGFGLFDLAGNVREWCWDAFDPAFYSQAAASVDDPHGPTGIRDYRTLRGGSWRTDASVARCASREGISPGEAVDFVGFRCVIGF